MKRLDNIEDQRRGVVTYELSDGRRIPFNAQAVQEHGVAALMRYCGFGHLIPTERVPVFQDGRRIGTMAPDFDLTNIKSRSFMYDARPGDFVRDGDKWIASRMLGASDPDCVVGFERDR